MFGFDVFPVFQSVLLTNIVKILLILLFAYFANKLGSKIINTFLKQRFRFSKLAAENRFTTIGKLLQNIWMYFIYFITIMMILPVFHINIAPILASAGVLGLAIGFGAQALVKDTVTGFFILLEGQYSVGDHVVLNGVEGTVKELGLRTTKLMNDDKDVFYISNGSITSVTNKSQEKDLSKVAATDEIPFE